MNSGEGTGTMPAKVKSMGLLGIDAYVVEAEGYVPREGDSTGAAVSYII